MSALAIGCLAVLVLPAPPAAAQTVKVRNAAPGATIEVVYNSAVVATASADGRGAADIALPASGDRPEIGALVFVDECGARRRVIVGAQGLPAAPQEAGCLRREIPGLFLVKPESTLVVNAGEAPPTLLLRQRPFDPDAPPRTWAAAPTGLILSGGAGLTFLGDTSLLACGSVADCKADDTGFGFAASASYWFTPYLAAEVGLLRPADMKAEGSGTNFRFTSTLDTRVVTLGGKVGIPVGPVRFFGKGGADFHRATFTTSQTIDDRTITVDEVPQTIPGGTQELALQTEGWGWVIGGGLELWLSRHFALNGEFGRATMKGKARNDVEGELDDHAYYLFVGASVRIGR